MTERDYPALSSGAIRALESAASDLVRSQLMIGLLVRLARPLAIAASLALSAGVMLTLFQLLTLGWGMYAIGHVLAIFAFVAIAATYREKMDGWSWLGLAVLLVGLVGGLAAVLSIALAYTQQGGVAAGPAQSMLLPADAAPIGLAAELVTWVGLAMFGLALRGARALPRGIAWVFLAAAMIGVLGDLRLVSSLVWVLAILVMAWGLLGVGVSLRGTAREGVTSSA